MTDPVEKPVHDIDLGNLEIVNSYDEEEIKEAMSELVPLWTSNPIQYEIRRNDLQKTVLTGVSKRSIDRMCKLLAEAASPPQLPAPTEVDVADILIEIAVEQSKLWHDPSREGYASIEYKGHLEHYKVVSRDFMDLLSNKFVEAFQEGQKRKHYPKKKDESEALHQIEAHCRRGQEITPGLRLMENCGALWIDKCDEAWTGFVVTAEGWRIVEKLHAPLVRADGMRPLATPEAGGTIFDLRQFVNFEEQEDFVLFVGDMATTMNPFGSFLTTILCGPPGSAKTTMARIFRYFCDPNRIPTRLVGHDAKRDLMHGVANTHIVGLENVTEIDDDMSDAICGLNTETGYSERKLFAQGVEYTVNVRRPVIINGVPNDLAKKPDLVKRTITFTTEYLGGSFKSEDMFWRRFEAMRGKLQAVFLDGCVGAMKIRRQFGGDNDAAAVAMLGEGSHPRFKDALVWAEAFCRTVGFEPFEFMDAYRANQKVSQLRIMENNWLVIGIRKFAAKLTEPWKGTPAELVIELNKHMKLVPSSNKLVGELNWVVPCLFDLYGIKISTGKRLKQNDNRNGITIEKLKTALSVETVENLGVPRGTLSEAPKSDGVRTPPPEPISPEISPKILGLKRRI